MTLDNIKLEIDNLSDLLSTITENNEKERTIHMIDRLYYIYREMKKDPDFGGTA